MKSWILPLLLIALASNCKCQVSWNKCSPGATYPLHVTKFDVSPRPLKLDDYLAIDLSSTVTTNVTYPLTFSLTVNKIQFFGWEMRIPCLSLTSGLPVGSCEYDVCSSLDYLEDKYGCPPEFTSNHVPCLCPFDAVSYNTAVDMPIRLFLDTTGIPTIVRTLLRGRYRITVEVVDAHKTKVMCLELRVELS